MPVDQTSFPENKGFSLALRNGKIINFRLYFSIDNHLLRAILIIWNFLNRF